MKKVIFLLITVALCLCMSTCAYTEEPPPPDYAELMLQAAAEGDIQAGRAAEAEQRALLLETGSDGSCVSFDRLYLLAQYIDLQAGEPRLRQEQRICTGELVLNRMASAEFPDTMRGVLLQLGDGAASLARENLTAPAPSRASAEAAMDLLTGKRLMEPSVVFQRSERRGDVYATFADKLLGFTYFCRSEYRELYEDLPPGDGSPPPQALSPDAVSG